jgi:prokaryotic ubiquitin-like protein Pup
LQDWAGRALARIALRRLRATPRITEVRMTTKDTGGQRQAPRRSEEEQESEKAAQTGEDVKERQEKLTDDVDAILDEIDEVLEENAEEFVRSYVQKGGE